MSCKGYRTAVPTQLYPLATRLAAALGDGTDSLFALDGAVPVDRRDTLLTLLLIHDLHTAPLHRLDGAERFQHHPVVSRLKWELEGRLLIDLDKLDKLAAWQLPATATGAMRALGKIDLVPPVYQWLATDAEPDEIVGFLSFEGGPDGGFDDLVAACQIGLEGDPKVELARNYWDEMGKGSLARVHTELHHKLTRALGLVTPPRSDQPMEALERSVLSGLLATNRHLQPEMLGALGLLELQAGPRCRKVVSALERIGAGEDALDFYIEHATVDPRHGRDWVDNAIAPLEDDARWSTGIVRGARWRSMVNARFFTAMHDRFATALSQAS